MLGPELEPIVIPERMSIPGRKSVMPTCICERVVDRIVDGVALVGHVDFIDEIRSNRSEF